MRDGKDFSSSSLFACHFATEFFSDFFFPSVKVESVMILCPTVRLACVGGLKLSGHQKSGGKKHVWPAPVHLARFNIWYVA